jgi:hypothetical protein
MNDLVTRLEKTISNLEIRERSGSGGGVYILAGNRGLNRS